MRAAMAAAVLVTAAVLVYRGLPGSVHAPLAPSAASASRPPGRCHYRGYFFSPLEASILGSAA